MFLIPQITGWTWLRPQFHNLELTPTSPTNTLLFYFLQIPALTYSRSCIQSYISEPVLSVPDNVSSHRNPLAPDYVVDVVTPLKVWPGLHGGKEFVKEIPPPVTKREGQASPPPSSALPGSRPPLSLQLPWHFCEEHSPGYAPTLLFHSNLCSLVQNVAFSINLWWLISLSRYNCCRKFSE